MRHHAPEARGQANSTPVADARQADPRPFSWESPTDPASSQSLKSPLSLRRLRFAPDLEQDYQAEYFANSIGTLRIVLGLSLCIVALYGLTEASLAPEHRTRRWLVRYGIVCPLLLLLLVLSFLPGYRRYSQVSGAVAVLAFGFGVIAAQIEEPGIAAFIYPNLLFLILCAYMLMRIQVLYAATASWTLIAGYVLTAYFVSPPLRANLSNVLVYLLAGNLFGTIGAVSMERYVRRDFLLTRHLAAEQQRSEQLLLNILPVAIVQRLKNDSGAIADVFAEVTVLFADIVGFTPMSARMPPVEVVELLGRVFASMDGLADKHGLEKIKTIGDAYMAVGGLSEPQSNHAACMADFALEMRECVARFTDPDGMPLQLRIGINTGSVIAGVIGRKRSIYDLWGDAVNLAHRMEVQGLPGEIQVTEATSRLLSGAFDLVERGEIDIKGRGSARVFLVTGRLVIPGSADSESGSRNSTKTP